MKIFFLLAFVLVVRIVDSIESRFDEYLWTKSTWTDFKLSKSYESWRVEDDPLVAQYSSLVREAGCKFMSVDGPRHRSPVSSSDELEYQEWLHNLIDQLVNDRSLSDPVCETIIKLSWEELTESILDKDNTPPHQLKSILSESCSTVVQDVLEKYSLVQVKDDDKVEWIFQVKEEDAVGRYEEEGAVHSVCDQFLNARYAKYETQAIHGIRNYEEVVENILHKQLALAKKIKESDGVLDFSVCQDLHPHCEHWADHGECYLNPEYMRYFCRLSCGDCAGDPNFFKKGHYYFSKESLSELEMKSKKIRSDIKNHVCIPHSFKDGSQRRVEVLEYDPILKGDEEIDVQQALYIELKGRCLLLFRGWWNYELCFFSTLKQLHQEDENESISQSHLIGTFSVQEAQSDGHLTMDGKAMKRYGFPEKPRAYIQQTYSNGDECIVDGEAVKRQALVRFMCSEGLPVEVIDTAFISASIEETKECFYEINVFLHLLCRYPDYSV